MKTTRERKSSNGGAVAENGEMGTVLLTHSLQIERNTTKKEFTEQANDHLFDVKIDARFEMMNKRPRVAKSEWSYFLTANTLEDNPSQISKTK